jgi:hypothetical protein
MSTVVADMTFSAFGSDHRLEIASLDAIRAPDCVSTLVLFSWKIRIRHGRPLA